MAQEVFGAAFVLSGLRYDRARIATLYQRLIMTLEDSTTYQWILEQGEAKGVAKGEVKGETRGRLIEARAMILRIGTRRFGTPPATVSAALDGIADREHLERIAERITDAADWNDLLATL